MPPRPKIVDALIIGGGPAGLSASLALARTRCTAIVFDSSSYRNEGVTHMHTVPSRDHFSPAEFRSISRSQITSRYDSIFFENATIVRAAQKTLAENYAGFEVTDAQGTTYEGRKLILATGSKDLLPDIEGYKENWPSHVYQCLACDGFEQRGTPNAVMDCGPKTAHFVHMARKFDDRVTVLTNGPVPEDTSIQQQMRVCQSYGAKIDTRKVVRLVNNGPTHEEGVTVHFEEGEPMTFGFIAHKPKTVNRGQDLIDQLGLECVDPAMGGGAKIVNPVVNATNVKGVFVGGNTMVMMKQVAIAMGEGLKAAGGVMGELAGEQEKAALKALEEQDAKESQQSQGAGVVLSSGAAAVAAKSQP